MEFYGLLLVVSLSIFIGIGRAQIKPILINVGSNSSIGRDGRRWIGDSISGENFTLSSPGFIVSTEVVVVEEPFYENLYRTARIFNTTSHYKFSVLSGNYLVRLHFRLFPFGYFDVNESAFDVRANDQKLLSKFSVPGELYQKNMRWNLNISSLVKEYFLSVKSNELLIEFSPNFGSFAFVNAIEVIPVFGKLFHETVNKVGSNGLNTSLVDRGMETMHRLNVGVRENEFSEDSNLWRRWNSDERYMFSLNAATPITNTSSISFASPNDSSTAPLLIYETARITNNSQVMEKRFNMSWKVDVDPNFDYLVRLHFCELFSDSANERAFKIYINNKTADDHFDVFLRAGGKNKAYHEDYVVAISPQIDTLWVQLGPEPSTNSDPFLNGLEVFKLSQDGNLAHVSERIDTDGVKLPSERRKNLFLWVEIGAGFLLVSALCSAFICFYIRKKKMTLVKDDLPANDNPPVWRPLFLHRMMGSTANARASDAPPNVNGSVATTRMGRIFTLAEIRTATNNFDESLVIGTGGFGKVYKGEIKEGALVAIKRGNPQSEQGLTEFETEIEMLSKLRHRHLVSLIGYCDEQNEMILVYEYMANGTLRSHLFGSDLPPLTWKQRLEACIGAARGLHYLHTGAERGIIHRDVKTTNILLDETFVAKMADFGLSKTGPALEHTHVSTAVKGSFGYLDPEYFRRQQLTQKSDVYSFGVVLFEVVCARSVINPTLPKDEINLAEWALRWQRQQLLKTIVDPRLEGNYSMESLKRFGEIAEKCLADEGKNRPTMGEVLWHLEYILQLHETYMQGGDATSLAMTELRFADSSLSLPFIKEGEEEACSEPICSDSNSVGPKAEGTD